MRAIFLKKNLGGGWIFYIPLQSGQSGDLIYSEFTLGWFMFVFLL